MGMEGTSVLLPSLEGMEHVKSDGGEILSGPFLDVCKHVLPVLGIFKCFIFFSLF